MSGTQGICTNSPDICTKAGEKAIQDVPPGAEYKCSECRLSLSPPPRKTGIPRPLIAAAAVVLLLGAAAYGLTSALSGGDAEDGDTASVAPLPGEEPQPGEPPQPEPPRPPEGPVVEPLRPREPVAAPPRPRELVVEPPRRTEPVVETAPVTRPPADTVSAPAPPETTTPPVATVPPPAPAPPAPAPPAPPAAAAAVLPGRSSIQANLASEICQDASRVGDTVEMVLADDLNLTNGVVAPAGSVLSGAITRKISNPGNPTQIQIEAKGLTLGRQAMALVTNPITFTVPRPSRRGAITKGAIIGGLSGVAVGVILKQGVERTALIGGAGAAVGAVVAGRAGGKEDACVASSESRFVFTSTKDAMLQ